MNVFFTTTPRFKTDFDKNVKAIYQTIEELGYRHTSDYLLKVSEEDFYKSGKGQVPVYYDTIINSLKKADIVVFEASFPSIGVGLLLDMALDLGKGVVALHMKGKFPFFLGGVRDDKLAIEEYTIDNLKKILKISLEYSADQMDTRFNFFISPKIGNYLDWVAKKRKIPRAVYLRRLIEKEMDNNKGYSKS